MAKGLQCPTQISLGLKEQDLLADHMLHHMPECPSILESPKEERFIVISQEWYPLRAINLGAGGWMIVCALVTLLFPQLHGSCSEDGNKVSFDWRLIVIHSYGA